MTCASLDDVARVIAYLSSYCKCMRLDRLTRCCTLVPEAQNQAGDDADAQARGNRTRNTLPLPGWDVTLIAP